MKSKLLEIDKFKDVAMDLEAAVPSRSTSALISRDLEPDLQEIRVLNTIRALKMYRTASRKKLAAQEKGLAKIALWVGAIILGLLLVWVGNVAAGTTKESTEVSDTKKSKKAGSDKPVFEVTSPAFESGKKIPKKFTCDGEDVSPILSFVNVPKGTKSFALVMDDPDTPWGTWVHWVIYDIPAKVAVLDENLPRKEKLRSDAIQGMAWGIRQYSRLGYYGPCPPPGKPHNYQFRAYALDKVLGLPPKSSKQDLEKAMKGHVLAEALLVGLYQR